MAFYALPKESCGNAMYAVSFLFLLCLNSMFVHASSSSDTLRRNVLAT